MVDRAAIREQVEFWLGDANLRRDKFLRQAVGSSDGGWVPLETLLSFNKMKELTSSADELAAAIREHVAAARECASNK